MTLAPEAGTQRLRDVINKGVTEEDLMQACTNAFTSGWNRVKLYFMLGLPTETDEDLAGIAELGYRVSDLYRSITGRMNAHVTISVSSFVPKPFTPFQWFGQIPKTEIERRQLYLKSQIKSRNIHYRYHDAPTSLLEAVLARGSKARSLTAGRIGSSRNIGTKRFRRPVSIRATMRSGSVISMSRCPGIISIAA